MSCSPEDRLDGVKEGSLMARMPEHMRARLDARNRPKEPRTPGREPPPKAPGTPGRSLPPKAPGTPSKELPPSRSAAQQQHLPPSTGGKENGRTYASPSKILTPSKCVLEVERLKRQREQRRQQLEERGDRGSADHETLIAQFRSSLHVPVCRSDEASHEESPVADEAQRSPLCVYVRKRPLLGPEVAVGQFDVLTPTLTTVTLHEAKRRVDLAKMLEHHAFTFDQVFDEAASTARLYQEAVRPLVRSAFEGCRATCFAFGQTGSGKTHTMMGDGVAPPCASHGTDGADGASGFDGVYRMATAEVFVALRQRPGLELGVSIYEIYNEGVYDLLGAASGSKLHVLEDARGEVQLVGLTEARATRPADVLEALARAQQVRKTGNNAVNERSSRSHAVLQLCLRTAAGEGGGGGVLFSKLALVDRAGSERAADTQHADAQARSEGAGINKSLLCLKECIRAMAAGRGTHVPFRGSKLTQARRPCRYCATMSYYGYTYLGYTYLADPT